MNRDRIRKMSLVGLLALAVAAFAYFAVIRRQSIHETAMAQTAGSRAEMAKMEPSSGSCRSGSPDRDSAG